MTCNNCFKNTGVGLILRDDRVGPTKDHSKIKNWMGKLTFEIDRL